MVQRFKTPPLQGGNRKFESCPVHSGDFLICEFRAIELISNKDVYILENLKQNIIQESEWELKGYSGKRKLVPEKRWDLNCLIEGSLKYRIPSDDEAVLCLYMPQKALSKCVKKIEGLLK